jgi:hypothetical protein
LVAPPTSPTAIGLFGRHRHQNLAPVDHEIAGNADGNPNGSDGILDHVIGLLDGRPVLRPERLQGVLVETRRLGELVMATVRVQAAEFDSARCHHGWLL